MMHPYFIRSTGLSATLLSLPLFAACGLFDGSTGSDDTNTSGDEDSTATGTPTTGEPGTGTAGGTDTGASTTDAATTSATAASSSGGLLCDSCDEPNQVCQDGVCITGCQGQDPSPCGADELCDIITGECKPKDDDCLLAGPSTACDAKQCGPGSVCDDQGGCVPVAPCVDVACTDGGDCWGVACACERPIACADPSLEALNGPFSDKIIGLDFADDCTAWMVTLRDGVDYLRRLTPADELTEWPGVSMMLMRLSRQKHVVAADVIVMPRSCSCSIQSMTAVPSCTSPILYVMPV